MDGKREDQCSEMVASKRHLLILCSVLAAVMTAGLLAQSRAGGGEHGAGSGGTQLYLGLLAAEWGLFAYVRAGLHRHGTPLRALISARPLTAPTIALDLLFGLFVFGLFIGAEVLLDRLAGSGPVAGVQPLLVRHAADVPLWIALSASAGFVEELVFRGYLQHQFAALLGSRWLGLFAQALLFGVSHGYQGGMQMLKIAILGLVFGAAAMARRSLVPGMAAHAAADIVGGLALFR
jgi:membrane protease YdiL (CAAX protease family)